MPTFEESFLAHDLLARLDHAVDAQDWDTYLGHFSDDATMDPGFAPPVQGKDAIRGFLAATEGNTRGKRHVATNVVVDEGPEGLVARSYLTVVERDDVPKIVATAVVEDHLRRAGGRLVVTRHVVRVDPGMFKAYALAQAQGQG